MKCIRIMYGTKSNAGGFEIESNKEVVADTWDSSTYNYSIMVVLTFQLMRKC